jgi:hypothetical protein
MPRMILPDSWRHRLGDLLWLSKLIGAHRVKILVFAGSPDTDVGRRWRLLALVRLREYTRKQR